MSEPRGAVPAGGSPPGGDAPGELAILLHSHMPYVEGYGTWPFGEEWLWEAMATCYLPLLELLDEGAPVTLSVTPVLADQLEAPAIGERFMTFLRDVRASTHGTDIEGLRAAGEPGLAAELERAARDYSGAAVRFEQIGGDLLAALAPHVSWTSAASHAVLPLLATDAGARLQIRAGIESHRRRFGDTWGGGFWLPECAHAEWLDPLLEEAGVHATCIDLTDVLGAGSHRHLTPLRSAAGPLLVPIDRVTIELVWSDDGYPADGGYRDYHRRTIHDHKPWANDGSPYDHAAALRLARRHAADFVARTIARLTQAAEHERAGGPGGRDDGPGPLAVCALDTELLGHWWYEGVEWLRAVLAEARAQGLTLTRLDDALARREPQPAPPDLPTTTWGSPRDLRTWDGPDVADLAWRARAAELDVVLGERAASLPAMRPLLALQASDWAFMVSRSLAGPYPRDRSDSHARALSGALAAVGSAPADDRNLAPFATPAALLEP